MMTTVDLRGGPDPATDDRVARLDALYWAEYAGMVRLAFTLSASNAEADEIVRDSLIDVVRRWHEIRKPGAYLRSAGRPRARCRNGRVPDLLRVSRAGTVTNAPVRRLPDPHRSLTLH